MSLRGLVATIWLRYRVLDQGPIWRDVAVFVSLSSSADKVRGSSVADQGSARFGMPEPFV